VHREEWQKIKERIDRSKPAPPTSTVRTKRLKERRRQGFICVTISLHKAQIGELVYRGLLPNSQRSDRAAIAKAIASILHDAIMPKNAWLIELRSQ
jgi:hypothetical protein